MKIGDLRHRIIIFSFEVYEDEWGNWIEALGPSLSLGPSSVGLVREGGMLGSLEDGKWSLGLALLALFPFGGGSRFARGL